MSHVEIKKLFSLIKFIRKYSNVPICIDTEGAQIRTSLKIRRLLKKNSIFIFKKLKKKNIFYPENVNSDLKKGDILSIGFKGLEVLVQENNQKRIKMKVLKSGFFEVNKGVYLKNRVIKLNFLTEKDLEAISIAKKFKINNFALSFTNSIDDIKKFSNILPNQNKIYKIETKKAYKDFNKIVKKGQNFLIDRGDLSKEVSIEMIPVAQRKILQLGKKYKKNIYVATNFLESMIENNSPTRAEVNDIFSTLRLGAAGLVLAAETAIGKFPNDCIIFLKKIYKIFDKNHKKFQ